MVAPEKVKHLCSHEPSATCNAINFSKVGTYTNYSKYVIDYLSVPAVNGNSDTGSTIYFSIKNLKYASTSIILCSIKVRRDSGFLESRIGRQTLTFEVLFLTTVHAQAFVLPKSFADFFF